MTDSYVHAAKFGLSDETCRLHRGLGLCCQHQKRHGDHRGRGSCLAETFASPPPPQTDQLKGRNQNWGPLPGRRLF